MKIASLFVRMALVALCAASACPVSAAAPRLKTAAQQTIPVDPLTGNRIAYVLSRDGKTGKVGPIFHLPSTGIDTKTHQRVENLDKASVEVLNACGFYLIQGGFARVPVGKKIAGWKIFENAAFPVYEDKEAVNPSPSSDEGSGSNPSAGPKATVYSKLKLCIAIASIGKWKQFEEWLNATEINGLPLSAAFQQCSYLKDDNPLFAQGKAAAAAALGMTGEQIDAILAQSVDDEEN